MFEKLDDSSILLNLEDYERNVLTDLFTQLSDLLEVEPATSDPLAALVGPIGTGEIPEDPAVARLFPDAYRDDEQSSQDFRRFTEGELRVSKHARVTQALASIAQPAQDYVLDKAQALAWLGALNDARLVFAVRIGVDEDFDHDSDDPSAMVYGWLTWLQGELIEALN